MQCDLVFTTIEAADLSSGVIVRHSKTRVEPFSRDKLLISIHGSLLHRKSPLSDASALLDTITSNVVRTSDNSKIHVNSITSEVIEVLKRFDAAAATHYKAFHPEASS